jgi:hypothetical protein
VRLPPPPSNEKGPPQKGGPFSLGAKREDLVQTLRFDKLAATGEFETRREATKPAGSQRPKGCCDQSLARNVEIKPIVLFKRRWWRSSQSLSLRHAVCELETLPRD